MGVEDIDGKLVAKADDLNILRGQGIVRKIASTKETEYSNTTILRTERELVIKVVLPSRKIK